MSQKFDYNDRVLLKGNDTVVFRVEMCNGKDSEGQNTYELECNHGTLDFIPEKFLVKAPRQPRRGDVYRVLGDFTNDRVHLHIIDVDSGNVTYFRTDDHFSGTRIVTSYALDLSECELILEGPK